MVVLQEGDLLVVRASLEGVVQEVEERRGQVGLRIDRAIVGIMGVCVCVYMYGCMRLYMGVCMGVYLRVCAYRYVFVYECMCLCVYRCCRGFGLIQERRFVFRIVLVETQKVG